MLKVGITGGIGSGKTTVSKIFESLGVPVYCDDDEARKITDSDPEVIEKIKATFGEEMYTEGKLDRQKLGSTVFGDSEKMSLLNSIVHPVSRKKWEEWLNIQKAPYVLREVAIMFETGLDKDMDLVILVSAPENLRVERVMKRNSLTREQVIKRISSQMSEKEKIKRSHLIIFNDGRSLSSQVMILNRNLNQIEKS